MPANATYERDLSKISTEYIYNETIGSFLLLLLSSVENFKNNHEEELFPAPQSVLDIKKTVQQNILCLDTILNDGAKKEEALEGCLSLRKKLIGIYKNVYAYYTQWNIVSTLVSDEIALRKYHEEKKGDTGINYELFYSDCREFLQNCDSISKMRQHMGQILKCLPFHMARDTYYDLIYRSLNEAFADTGEQEIQISLDMLSEICIPSAENTEFQKLVQWLKEKIQIMPGTLTDTELEAVYEEMGAVYQALEQLEDHFQTTFSDINSLIILYSLRFTFEDIVSGHFEYKDIHAKVSEIIESEDAPEKDAFCETICVLLEEYIEPVLDKANELNQKEMRLMKQIHDLDVLSDDTKKILLTEEFVRSTFYAELNQDLFDFQTDENAPAAADEFRKWKLDAFLNGLRNYFSALPVRYRKAAMALLLSSVPINYSVDKIINMIHDSIENAVSSEQKLLILDKIGAIFADNGFDPHGQAQEADHCGCGHIHSHNHECGCGHEHNHEHK